MKKIILLAIGILTTYGLTQCHTSTKKEEQKVTPLPPLPIGSSSSVKGISAPFAAVYKEELWIAGGCNFPNQPAADGGSKAYYSDIYKYTEESGEWEYKGELPLPLAYGASVIYKDRWICIGGNNSQTASASVLSIVLDNSTLQIDTLPSLPIPLDNTAAVRNQSYLYAGGGICNGKPTNRFFRLNLDEPTEWEELTSYPQPARVQLQLACGKDDEILLLGGFNGGNLTDKPVIPEQVWSYQPQNNSWKEVATLPLCTDDTTALALVGGFAIPLNDSILLIGGGVNRNRFNEALKFGNQVLLAQTENRNNSVDSLKTLQRNYLLQPVEWYNFNQEIFLFNTNSKEWENSFRVLQSARAGAGVGKINNSLYFIGGELKPGIRTDEANKVDI